MTEQDENDVPVLDYGVRPPDPFQRFWKYAIVCSAMATVGVWLGRYWYLTYGSYNFSRAQKGALFALVSVLIGLGMVVSAIGGLCIGGFTKRAMVAFVVILLLTGLQLE